MKLQNPAIVDKPRLNSPVETRRRNGKGNLPYIRARKRMRRELFR